MPTRIHLFPGALTLIGVLYIGRRIDLFRISSTIDWFYGGVGLPPYWQGPLIGGGSFTGYPWDVVKLLYVRSKVNMDIDVFQGWWWERA
jgi:hypothetical protein